MTFRGWMESLPPEVLAIPEDDPVFAYAKRVGLPIEFVALEWGWFKAKYGQSSKRYTRWPQTFRNAVEGAWGNLWRIGADGSYQLTTQGMQLQRSLEVAE
ncbi:hypothetical protein [Dyella sp. M7H15-1]|uniref:hypothetical protein n=1 Tax=Dyella sp. M7H15-1 TaxID=2501295 RepID=UPI001F0BD435|nr:hypothetical protein [Dyella sp. M7H15-1]